MKLTITKVVKNDTNKAGDAYISKAGKPYSRASIKTAEYGDVWLGGFWSDALKEGSTIEAEITEREYNGKTYKDFKIAKKTEQKDFTPSLVELKNLINLQIMPFLRENNTILKAIAEQKGVDLSDIIVNKPPYPEFNETNDASPF